MSSRITSFGFNVSPQTVCTETLAFLVNYKRLLLHSSYFPQVYKQGLCENLMDTGIYPINIASGLMDALEVFNNIRAIISIRLNDDLKTPMENLSSATDADLRVNR